MWLTQVGSIILWIDANCVYFDGMTRSRAILIAPDSFKGSLSSREVCHAIADGIKRVAPDCWR